MNAYKLNGNLGHLARTAIVEGLNIHHVDIYCNVKDIQGEIIITKDGKKYKLKLEEIE